jgi:hypothetical protein
MLPSFVMPEIVLDVAMFIVVSFVLKFIPLGTWARSWAGHLPSVLSGHHRSGADLVDRQGVRRSCHGPRRAASSSNQQDPAAAAVSRILTSFAIAFADSLDFVTVRYLSCPPAVSGTSRTAARQGANGRQASPSSRTSERTYAVAARSRSVLMGAPVSIKTRSASGGRWTETGWPCA